MTKKHAALILISSFILMLSGCVNYRYGTGLPTPASRPVVNAPPPASYERPAPPPWAPAHGHRAKYRYRYYPLNRIYFDTGRRIYFYYRNGSWAVSAFLPQGIRLGADDYVTLEMDSDRPYTFHREIQKRYPPGQMKNMRKERDRMENDYRYENKYNARHQYRYYPSNEIYFDTGRRIYFFYRNGSWSASASLPRGIRLSADDYVTLELNTNRPYTRHNEIRKNYPPGQMKKMKKEKGRGKNKNKYNTRYNYRYYPSKEIYFDTGRGLYFYYKNGSWSASASLPRGIKLSVDDFVTFELDSDKPYTHHGEIQKKYPPGQVKKKGKGKNKDRYDDEYDDRYDERDGVRYRLN